MSEAVRHQPPRFWPRSLRWQLQMWQAFLFACMLVAFGVTVYKLAGAYRFRQTDADLQLRVTALRKIIHQGRQRELPPPRDHRVGPPDEPPGGPPPNWRPPPESFVPGHLPPDFAVPPETAALFGPDSGFYFLIWSRAGSILRQSLNAPNRSRNPTPAERDSLAHARTWETYRELIHCSGVGDCVVVGRSVAADLRSAAAIRWLLPLAGATVLLLGFIVGWWLITRAVRPVSAMQATAAQISAGNLAARIPVTHPGNELGQLSAVLNGTFATLERVFERQRQFTSDAAHELRTPLAIMIAEAQSSLAQPRTAAEYKLSLEECLATAQQMRRLTDTLLDLADLDIPEAHTLRSKIDLADIALRCINQLEPIASSRAIALTHNLSSAPTFRLADRVSLVVMNLLMNAISYNQPGGQIFIQTSTSNQSATLIVKDTGIGISSSDLPRIFDRFYRADKARSQSSGHAGLGLSICKAILDAEGGTIQVESEIGCGAVFTVAFPES